MDFDCRTVSLTRIRDEDITYRITTGHASKGLIHSIERIGLINPPILRPMDEHFVVVSGFGRIGACRALNWERIPVRCIPVQSSILDCALVAIADNTAQRALNIVEMARSFGLIAGVCGEEDAHASLQLLNALGLPVNAELGKKLNAVNQMSPMLQEGLIDGTIALPTALRLHAMMAATEVNHLCHMIRELNLSLNRQREMLDWVNGIAMREGIAIGEVVGIDPIDGWMGDRKMDRGRKSHLIREHLKRRRYPEMVRFEEQYLRSVKALNLAEGIRLLPPANFEGRTFGLHLSFEDQRELAQVLGQIEQLIHSPSFLALLTPIDTYPMSTK